MLRYTNVSKEFPGGVVAVKDLDLHVGAGRIYVMLGANGAGKTTTILMTLGFLDQTEGQILIDGIDVQKRPIDAKRRLSFVSENVTLYGNFSALQNIRFFCRLGGQLPPEEEIHRVLDLFSLMPEARSRRVKTYSKGMRQRTGLAIAILKQTPLIIMDEPLSGLDPKGAKELLDIFLGLREEGRTIFMTTHDIFRARTIADEVGIMNRGQLVERVQRSSFDDIDLENLYMEAVSTD